jgi:Immune inhibitor A-like, MAM domain
VTLDSAGLGMWRSTDDRDSFTFLGNPHVGSLDDKELLAVDNNLASLHYGRLYVAWVDFASRRIFVTTSGDGSTWSTPVAVSDVSADVQGAWPAVAPSGDVYVAWVCWNPYPNGPIEVVRSTNGGTSLAVDPSTVSDQRLASPAILVPNDPSATLRFWNHQTLEHRAGGGCYDGAIVETSTDGGATFTQITTGLLSDPYDGVVDSCCENPISGQQAWCGDPQDWLESIVSLAPYAGQTVQLRFRLASDVGTSKEGWYVDDVVVQNCVLAAPILDDGFESGDTTVWTLSSP